MAFVDSYDIRMPVIIGTSLITALLLSVRRTGTLRRIAIGLLACEAGIVIMGLINALVFQDPVSLNYAEQIHAPLLIFMFILFTLFVGTRLILALKEVGFIIFGQITSSPMLFWKPRYRTIAFALPWTIFLAMSLTIPKWSWTSYEYPPYPPAQPPSVKLLQQEIGLAPGKQFRGRLLVLLGQDVLGSNLSTLLGYLISVGRDSYGRYLGNDHWVDLLPFNIPIINEYAHWTSPVSFVVLRAFFGKREDVFEKALFVLRSFNPNVARMMGVRMIVTESPSVSGAILAYETMGGGVPLRIFRLDKVNVGQYSPTRPIRIANAAEAIEILSHDSFVAERDILTEDEIPDGLVPGKLISLTTNLGPTLRVHAVSSGRSILVLPFEYSKCLCLNAMLGHSSQLIPVNLQQTGLLFEGETELEISYRFGPLDQPRCRREDLKRIDRLQLRNAF